MFAPQSDAIQTPTDIAPGGDKAMITVILKHLFTSRSSIRKI